MAPVLVRSIRSEWLKTRGSLVGWLVAGAGLFVPTILILARIKNPNSGARAHRTLPFWEALWNQNWEALTVIVIPISSILLVSVVTQVETRANGWKQVEATPQPLGTIFLAKLATILALVGILLCWINLGLGATAVIPALVASGAPRPSGPFPFGLFVERTLALLIATLPVIGIQYLVALRSRTFLTPLGIGMAIWFLSIGMLSWRHNYLFPYAYGAVGYLHILDPRAASPRVPIQPLALLVFLAASGAGYVAYRTKTDRG